MIKDIISYNTNKQKHSYWEVYYFNGNLWYKRLYQNGKRVGIEEWYSNTHKGKLYEKIYHL
jgi:antitoxin component YwqK of YwqJK toxin-antitoxin module